MYIQTLQNAWADHFGTFPTKGGLVELEEHQAVFLMALADGIATSEPCEVGPECEACKAIAVQWWVNYHAIDRRVTFRMEVVMRTVGIPLPPYGDRHYVTNDLSASRN